MVQLPDLIFTKGLPAAEVGRAHGSSGGTGAANVRGVIREKEAGKDPFIQVGKLRF